MNVSTERNRSPSPKRKKEGREKSDVTVDEFESMPDEHRAILLAVLDDRVPLDLVSWGHTAGGWTDQFSRTYVRTHARTWTTRVTSTASRH